MSKRKRLTLVALIAGPLLIAALMLSFFNKPVGAPVATHHLESVTKDHAVLGLKTMQPRDFKKLFDTLGLPNQVPIVKAPAITGNVSTDQQIRAVAIRRGYRLWSVPGSELVKVQNVTLQPLAAAGWEALDEAAKQEGIAIKIVYGYRSVEDQRQLFLNSFQGGGSTASIDQVLQRVAPPGFSKHHTGYTVDLADGKRPYDTFEKTEAYAWLARDNFANSKRFGFIPSYPKGDLLQGPEPEPWEFVWVGEAVLRE